MKTLLKKTVDLSSLFALPAAERRLRAINNARLLHELECRALIQEGYDLRFSDPAGGLLREELAYDVARELVRRRPARARFDLAAEAGAYLGNARRVVGEFREARKALREAGVLWRSGSRDEALRALMLEFRASVAEAERRFAEACKLLREAAAIWSRRGDLERLARVSVLAGIARAYAGQTEGALTDLREGLRLTSSLPLIRCAVLSIGWALVDAGLPEAARDVLAPYTEMLDDGEAQVRLKLEWIEGRIASEMARDAAAIAKLRAARDGYAALSLPQEWSLVTLDLAVHHGRYGRLSEVRGLAAQAAPVIQTLGVASHLVVAAHLEKIAAAGEALPAAANALSRMIRPRRAALV